MTTERINGIDIMVGLSDAVMALHRIAELVDEAAAKPGIVETDCVADLLHFAYRVQRDAVDVYTKLRHVGLIKAEGNAPENTLISPSGLVGWRAVKVHGQWAPASLHMMTDTELKAFQ